MDSFLRYDEFLFEKSYSKSVESSHIKDMKYDSETKVLEIEFNNGSVYEYSKVPKKVYLDLVEERNVLAKIGKGIIKGAKKLFGKKVEEGTYGTRFWSLIRNGDYDYKKVK